MKVGLFIPCYIDQLYPQVGIATLELLEREGVTVEYPLAQTCCGQPMGNAGYQRITGELSHKFISTFDNYEYVVSPSGSCVLFIREHLETSDHEPAHHIGQRTLELTEFLHDILKVEKLDAVFRHRVGLHQSCHGQRGLGLSRMSERMEPEFSKPARLLGCVEGLQLVTLDRIDECCGFGGTFSFTEEAVSSKMGLDRIDDHIRHGAEYITGNDMSCLMHLEGLLRRKKSSVKVLHIAEILNAKDN